MHHQQCAPIKHIEHAMMMMMICQSVHSCNPLCASSNPQHYLQQFCFSCKLLAYEDLGRLQVSPKVK